MVKFGNVVVVSKSKPFISLWDFDLNSYIYSPVVKALSKLMHSSKISGIFTSREKAIGIATTYEKINIDTVKIWNHFHIFIPIKILL